MTDTRVDVPSGALNAELGGLTRMQFDGPDHATVYPLMTRADELREHRRALVDEHLSGAADAERRQIIARIAELDALIAELGR